MAEIILVWNVHTNESPVTREMALKLKENLTQRGHKARIIKYPDELTIQHIFKNMGPHNNEIEEHNANYHGFNKVGKSHQVFMRDLKEKNPNSLIISLHTALDNGEYYDSLKLTKGKRKPKNWKTEISGNRKASAEIVLIPFFSIFTGKESDRAFQLEMPAKYRKEQKGLTQIFEHNETLKLNKVGMYFTREANLRETRVANYLSPTLVRKASHVISNLANRTVGHLTKRKLSKSKKWLERKMNRRRHLP